MSPTCPAKVLSLPSSPDAVGLRIVYSLERVAAIVFLLALMPAALLVSLIIWMLSGQSPLIRHTRVGRRGALLRVLKLRTMWGSPQPSAEPHHQKHLHDDRVTSRFAAFCRRYSLDEIPQLVHVIRGEMSIVGPRPITSDELAAHYANDIDEVLSIRPGITGLWQIMGRSRLTYAQRRRLDLLLVRKLSAGLYLRILLRSVPKVLTGVGAW